MNTDKRKVYFVISLILVLAVLLVVGAVFVLQSSQQYKSKAEVPQCHNGAMPGGFVPVPDCGDADGCPAPAPGQCKKKGVCYECRFDDNSLKMICPCTEPTTAPTSIAQAVCPPPNVCIPEAECGAQSNTTPPGVCKEGEKCCVPKIPTIPTSPTPTPKKLICELPYACLPLAQCGTAKMPPPATTDSYCGVGLQCCIPIQPTTTVAPTITPTSKPGATTAPATSTNTPTTKPVVTSMPSAGNEIGVIGLAAFGLVALFFAFIL